MITRNSDKEVYYNKTLNPPKHSCVAIHGTNKIKVTSLLAWWSELLTTKYEVPG
jgi:hypothetical protein